MANSETNPPVLVVEDNRQVSQFITQLLAELPWTTITAGTAESALAILQSAAPIALLLCDLGLPDGNGVDLARKAIALRPGLKVLLMSGYAIAGMGFDSILKPFEPDELLRKVRARLEE